MAIGITASSVCVTSEQIDALKSFAKILKIEHGTMHHGDCIEGDEKAHKVFEELGYEIHIHPPINPSKRAYCKGIIYSEKEYLVRNRDIVKEADFLIALPNTYTEKLRSGTWATVRYARECGKMIIIIYPDGRYEMRNYAHSDRSEVAETE